MCDVFNGEHVMETRPWFIVDNNVKRKAIASLIRVCERLTLDLVLLVMKDSSWKFVPEFCEYYCSNRWVIVFDIQVSEVSVARRSETASNCHLLKLCDRITDSLLL